MGKYITVQLPEEFVKEMIEPLLTDLKFGFSSRAEVVKEGVRIVFGKYIGWKQESKER